jgi:hypothetical protein
VHEELKRRGVTLMIPWESERAGPLLRLPWQETAAVSRTRPHFHAGFCLCLPATQATTSSPAGSSGRHYWQLLLWRTPDSSLKR